MKKGKGSSTKKQKKPMNWKEELFFWYKTLLLTASFAIFILSFVFTNSHVPTPSMEPAIMINDRLFGFRLQYLFSSPGRGDVVIFPFPDDPSILFAKRVIGLPGETITIINGQVYIDNHEYPLHEPYLLEEMRGSFGPYFVPEGHYFVLGDNRQRSSDSRHWTNTFVSERSIIARVLFRYFPRPGLVR